jgi:hydrogenase maturation protein HypF
VYRLAKQFQLTGWVRNCVGVVEIQVQGAPNLLDDFARDIINQAPQIAVPHVESFNVVASSDFADFTILDSAAQGDVNVQIPADLFLCDDCLREMNDPDNRRYHYPFINCTQCGPRFTLIRAMPYDRVNTTMEAFELCSACRTEYENPEDRRFHAEPIACHDCGPSLEYKPFGGKVYAGNKVALDACVRELFNGGIVAVKGIGGYHLMCDARSDEAVSRLREQKPRPDKPLAVMFPSPLDDPLSRVKLSVTLSKTQSHLLNSPARPIVLASKHHRNGLSRLIAPGLDEVGVMLPYSPLHHLLLNRFGGPLVATSANISGEPVLTEADDVEVRMSHITDGCLHHNRAIERPADDPVYRTIANKPRPIRTGRGSAPIELVLPFELAQPVLAVGAHMKNTVTLAWKNRAVISPHIGEMDTLRSYQVFENTINDLQNLYGVKAELIICDAHPGYAPTRWANRWSNQQNVSVETVFHHHAHASASYYECVSTSTSALASDEAILAFTWDGVGYGEDGTLWGGETFLGKPGEWKRVASMKPFYLPGADKAGREPWRSAAALCWEIGLPFEDIPVRDSLLKQAWIRKINSPQSTSVGRLFDAVAALTGVRTQASFEGQGPMELEALCPSLTDEFDKFIDIDLEKSDNLLKINWKSLIVEMIDSTLSVSQRSALLHNSLAHNILKQAKIFRKEHCVNTVSLCGGVFQNKVLSEQAMALLSADGFKVCLPEQIPVNDAGISFGQVIEYGYKQ